MIRKFKLPDNGIPIRVGDSSFIYKDVYHPIEWYGGEPYRPRVETLVLKDKGVDMLYMEKKKGNRYRVPGGSIDSDSSYEKQAENETNEEALLKVSDIAFANVVYHQEMDKDYIAKGGDSCVAYVASTTHVYTAYHTGPVDKSTIEEKDLDDDMAKNGKFYPIQSVLDILRVDHIKALINSGRIRDKLLESLLYKRLDYLTVEQPPSTIFEATRTSSQMETKYIYHGSTCDFDVFHPMSLDLGNAEQEPGWSTFCFRSYDLARRFALMRLIQKSFDGNTDAKHKCGWDLKENMPYLHHTVYAEALNKIKHEKIYVYAVDAEPLSLGIGNDERFPEVTFREDNVVPHKKDVIFTDEDTIKDDIKIIKESPDAYEKKQMQDIVNLNRGWVTCMLNRDYSGDSAVAKLTKAVSDGKLKPGDDVTAYMDENGIQLKDISFIERLQDARSIEEGFDLSSKFEETILLGDHRALYTSEKKEGDCVYNEDHVSEDEKFNPVPPDVNTVHKAYLYEIGDKGELTLMGYYHIFELGILDDDMIYVPKKYLLQLFVRQPYRKLGVGSLLAGYAIRYHKKHLSCPLAAEVPNSIWGIQKIQKWIKSFTASRVLRTDSHVAVTLDKTDDIATESCEQNLSNLTRYHAEMVRPGFNPKAAGGWDEELYSKTIEHAVKQAFMGAVGKDKELLKKNKFEMYMYTAGEELSAIYLGRVTMYYYGLEDNGYVPKFDWEWAEQEDFSDTFLRNLKEEIHPHLMESATSLVPPYVDKGTKKLSQFKKVKATYQVIEKYRDKASVLKWVEPENVDDGCVWLDNEKFVGVCTVAKNLLGKFTEITSLEVAEDYRGYKLGSQILDYAVKTLKGNVLMVEAINASAIMMYQRYGFKVSKASFDDVYNRLRHTYFMYLPSALSSDEKKAADEVRIGPDPVVEEVDIEVVSDSNVGIEDVTTEGIADSLLEPIFIVCTFTGTRFGKLVTKIQDCKFSHSGIALEPDLKTIYTFNMLSKRSGGAGIESIDKYNNVSTGGPGDVCVMCFFVPKTVKEKVSATIDYVFSNVNKTMYAFGNLVNILRNRAVETGNSLKMVCSQFVDYCLKMANVDITKKSSNLVSPNDFASIPKKNTKVFVLFDGKNTEYNPKKINNKIHRLLRSREPDELNVVAEGVSFMTNMLLEQSNSRNITFSKSSSDIKTVVKSMSEKEHFYIGADDKDQVWNEKNSFYKDVLLVDNKPVAFLMVFENSKKPGVGFIIIGTHKNYRRKGYGQMLIDRLISSTMPSRIKSLCWGFDRGNDASENLAKKNGFNKEGKSFRSGKIPLYLEVESLQPLSVREFTLPEQGDFDAYKNTADLDAAREAIPEDVMEGWIMALMEAKKDKGEDDLPSLGKDDKAEDYSGDAESSVDEEESEEQEEETPEEEPDDEQEEESNDYTDDADEEEGEDAQSDDQTDDPTSADDSSDESSSDDTNTDDLDDSGTDYTDDAGSSGESDSDDSGESSEEEPSDTGSEEKNDTESGNNGVKNHTLLTDFESLYRLASEISDTIEPIIMEKPIQNKVLTQVRSNLSAIKSSIMNFITTHFKANDYPFNLYYYEIFIGLLSKNLEILAKNKGFSSKDSKKNEKTNKE